MSCVTRCKNALATFTAAGTYFFTVTVRDAGGRTVLGNVTVTVGQTLTSLRVTPAVATISTNSNHQFVAIGFDQFGNALTTQPSIARSVLNGGGAIDAGGIYTPPATDGTATVRAAVGVISSTAEVAFSGMTLAAPTNLTATAVSAGQINLAWSDSVSGETGFVVEISTDGSAFTVLATTRSNAAGYNVTGLTPSTSYTFRVRSLNASGTGITSAPVAAATHATQGCYYPLDATSGTVLAEAGGKSIDGVARNGVAWAAGRLGNAPNFDGVDDSAELPNDTMTIAAGTVSLWVKTGQNFSDYAILSYVSSDTYGNGLGSQSELHVNFTSAEKIQLYIRGSAAGLWDKDVNITSASSCANNAWHHVTATWQAGGQAVLYVDGVAVGSQAFAPAFMFTNSLRTFLGRTNLDTNRYKGLIDDVRLFAGPVTAQQVETMAGGNSSPTVAAAATAGQSRT